MQLSAKPCIVTPLATRTPMAQILRSRLVSVAGSHTPERSSTRMVSTPYAGAHLHDRLLKLAHVADHVDGFSEANDGIANELAGTVPRDAAATIDVDDLAAVCWAIPGGRALACGVDGLVLNEQDSILGASHHLGVFRALARPRLAVRDQARTQVVWLDPHDSQANPATARGIPL